MEGLISSCCLIPAQGGDDISHSLGGGDDISHSLKAGMTFPTCAQPTPKIASQSWGPRKAGVTLSCVSLYKQGQVVYLTLCLFL